VALHPLNPSKLEFRSVDFCEGRKTGEPGEKPLKQGREPTNNSTHKVSVKKKTYVDVIVLKRS
jgi:hypothetical protein